MQWPRAVLMEKGEFSVPAGSADRLLRLGAQVQNILLLHDERLEGLEACAPAPPPGQGPPNQAPPDQTQRLAAGAVLNGSAPSMR